jgi:hypothetical protein
MDALHVEEIRVKNLYEFACQNQNGTFIPITKHRALAHTKNPYADENDIGLLAAFMGKLCIGYLGLLPSLLKTGDQFSKVYWLSTFYVPPEYRKTLAALHLMNKAFESKYDLFLTGISKEAQDFHRRLGSNELGPLDYYEIDVGRLNFLAQPSRLLIKILKSKFVDAATTASFLLIKKLFYNILLYRYRDNINYKEVSRIDEDDVNKRTKQNAFYRGNKIINWMLRHKWVLESKTADLKYQFSNVRDIFKYICLNIYSSKEEEDCQGFLVLSISSQDKKTVLKVLDFNVSNRAALSLALKYARIHLVDIIEIPDSLAEEFPLKSLLQNKKRTYLYYPKDKNSSLKHIKLSYCDGDIAFT